MRSLASNVLTLLIPVLVVVIVAIGWGQSRFTGEGPLTEPVVIEVPRGAGLVETSEILAKAGAIESPVIFRLGATYRGQAGQLKFGEYEIEPGASMEQVLAKLTSGDTIDYRVTIAEGLTSWEVVELLRQTDFLTGEVETVPDEGTLAPDTYFVARGDSRQSVIDRMQAAQASILAEAWASREENLPLSSPEEVLILASIVEKETGVASERPEVAAVFVNRLRRGMRLQSDPTIIYGITEGQGALGRGIRRSEIETRTDWNTYQIDGLPKTPIANPGQDAIEAVVNPATTEALYFVADGTGGHVFAETLAEHNRNVARWRQIERDRSQN